MCFKKKIAPPNTYVGTINTYVGTINPVVADYK